MSSVTHLYTSQSLSARVAAEVRGQAAKRGLKQKDLASLLNLSPGQISGRFGGRIPFKLEEIDVLARAFGLDAAELMPRRPDAPASGQQEGLLRLDLNQQPFGYKDPQVGALRSLADPTAAGPDLRLVSGGSGRRDEYQDQRAEYQGTTRSETDRPFVPVIVQTLTVSA